MNEKPILFSGPMVRAILDGRKAMTRRVVKRMVTEHPPCSLRPCPYGQPGDRLWVRETWATPMTEPCNRADKTCPQVAYAADGKSHHVNRWRPSIYMPRWASRITLEVTAVRVERLQEISRRDAIAEGCVGSGFDDDTPQAEFAELWDGINADRGYPWASNPWVWVIEFETTTTGADAGDTGDTGDRVNFFRLTT